MSEKNDEQKKDLTDLMDLAKQLEQSGEAPPMPEGLVIEEPPIEKIEAFESLDSLPAELAPPELPGLPGPEDPQLQPLPEPHESLDALHLTPPSPAEPAPAPPTDAQPEAPEALNALHLTPPSPAEPASEVAPPPEPLAEIPQEPLPEVMDEPLRPAPLRQDAPVEPLEKIRQYSEQFSSNQAAVTAAFPFSLLITGRLAPEEKERLLDLLSRENMGIREIDLEPQFESGKILIPRISEYAGVMLVGALRTARAKIRFGPSDEIFATADTQDSELGSRLDAQDHASQSFAEPSSHPAESLPITAQARLPGDVRHAIVDIVTASAALKTLIVEAERSPEYQELLEALTRELKYKAFRKGAHAIVGFKVQLTPLQLPSHYRVLVSGSAVRPDSN